MFEIAVNQSVAVLWASNLKVSSCNKKKKNTNEQSKMLLLNE
jgi:hypothetical protein